LIEQEQEKEKSENNLGKLCALLVTQNVCTGKTCKNYGQTCLILRGQHHQKLDSNDILAWATAIDNKQATLEAAPNSIRGVPAGIKATKVTLQGNVTNTISHAPPFNFPYMPYMPYPGYHTPLPPYYPHGGSSPPHAPPPRMPSAQIRTSNPQSSPLDIALPSNGTHKVGQYLDWFIARHPTEVEMLTVVKAKLLATGTDMEGIQMMGIDDAKEWGIEWGVGGRLKRNIGRFLKGKD
jgi:hypothetical protein